MGTQAKMDCVGSPPSRLVEGNCFCFKFIPYFRVEQGSQGEQLCYAKNNLEGFPGLCKGRVSRLLFWNSKVSHFRESLFYSVK